MVRRSLPFRTALGARLFSQPFVKTPVRCDMDKLHHADDAAFVKFSVLAKRVKCKTAHRKRLHEFMKEHPTDSISQLAEKWNVLK